MQEGQATTSNVCDLFSCRPPPANDVVVDAAAATYFLSLYSVYVIPLLLNITHVALLPVRFEKDKNLCVYKD